MSRHEANSYQVSLMPNISLHMHISLRERYPCQSRAERKDISAAPPKKRVIDGLPEPHYLSLNMEECVLKPLFLLPVPFLS